MYDVVIIGARCAGSPTAMLLARAGARVLLLDRSTFPSDTVSTHFLHPASLLRLERWGLLPALLKTGCPPVDRMSFNLADQDLRVAGAPLAVGEATSCLAPRRTVLDELLVRAATDAGAELRTQASFQAPMVRDGRVAGVTFTAGGRVFNERAQLVIGADGRHSSFARSVGARTSRDLGVISCQYYGYWSGLPDQGFQAYVRDGRMVTVFPTHDGRHVVLAGWHRDRFADVRRDLDRHFLTAYADLAPHLHEYLRQGTRAGKLVGSGNLTNLFRESAGPGWALVGDAGHAKDPVTAQGIGEAFAQAELLAGHVSRALGSGPGALDAAVRAYATDRDSPRCLERFELNALIAQFRIPDDLLPLLRPVLEEPAGVSRFLGVYAGHLTLDEFLAGDSSRGA